MFKSHPNLQVAVPVAVILLLALAISGYFFFNAGKNHANPPGTEQLVGQRESIHYGFWLPTTVSDDQANASLTNKKAVVLSPVSATWAGQISERALKDGWKLLATNYMTDGGSADYKYYMGAHVPAVEVYTEWDMNKGQIKSIDVQFIHPADLPSWLFQIASDKAIKGGSFDAAALADCKGILGKIHGDRVECIPTK